MKDGVDGTHEHGPGAGPPKSSLRLCTLNARMHTTTREAGELFESVISLGCYLSRDRYTNRYDFEQHAANLTRSFPCSDLVVIPRPNAQPASCYLQHLGGALSILYRSAWGWGARAGWLLGTVVVAVTTVTPWVESTEASWARPGGLAISVAVTVTVRRSHSCPSPGPDGRARRGACSFCTALTSNPRSSVSLPAVARATAARGALFLPCTPWARTTALLID